MLSSLPLAAAPQPPSPLRESIPTLVQPRSEVVEADDLVSRVRQEIERRLSTDADVLTVSTVGRTLGYSTRSLQRKLAERGTSLSALVDGARHDRALRLLSGDEISLAEVAQQLGFESVTAFFRAFRRWTGTTPRVFQSDQRRARTVTESMIPPSPLDEADQVEQQKQAV